jgi:hypothetical protein
MRIHFHNQALDNLSLLFELFFIEKQVLWNKNIGLIFLYEMFLIIDAMYR